LQVVQANATTSKPSSCSSGSRLASSRYSLTVFEPGASEDFTHGLRVRPSLLALRAIRPAAIMLRGLLVLVQLVIAAIMTAPSGIWPGVSSHALAIPRLCSSDTGSKACGLDGPARLRRTDDRSNVSTRSYSAVFRLSAHRPVALAYFSTSAICVSSRPVRRR